MGRSAASIAAVLALAGVLAACGTTDEDANTSGEETRTTPGQAEAEQPLSAAEEHGRDLFVENCGSCHTLDAAGTQGSIGPNLDEAQADEAEVLRKIAEGPGAMPSDLVSGDDARDVAVFVAGSGP